MQVPKRNSKGPLRMPILDFWRDEGHFFIYGKLENGTIFPGKTYLLQPK